MVKVLKFTSRSPLRGLLRNRTMFPVRFWCVLSPIPGRPVNVGIAQQSPWGRAHERVFALVVRGKPRSGVEEKSPLTLPAIRRASRAGREALSHKGRGIFVWSTR